MTAVEIVDQDGQLQVYNALRNMFQGQHVHLRQRRRIRRLIQVRPQEHAVQGLLQKYDLDTVVSVAQTLLGDGIFESEAKARSHFSSDFQLAEQDNAISKQATATSAANRTSNFPVEPNHLCDAKLSDGFDECGLATRKTFHRESEPKILILESEHKGSDISTQTHDNHLHNPPSFVCSLGPQHELMTQIQKAMEYMCFAFAQCQMPEVVRENWSCPQAVELRRWAKEFSTRPELFTGNRPSTELLQSVESVWQTAVHRERLTIQQLQQLVADTTALSTLLAVPEYEKLFATLSKQLKFIVYDAKCRQRRRAKLEAGAADIAKRRLELDREECEITMRLKELDVGQSTAADKMVSKMVDQLTSDFSGIVAAKLETDRSGGTDGTGEDTDSDADLVLC